MSADSKIEKVLIIGSGPAGLTAAIYTSRALLQPLMIEGEEAGGQLMITTDVENYPGFPKAVTGPELMTEFRAQAERFGTRFITKNVTKVDFSKRPFKVWVGNDLHLADTVIISTGASAKYLGIESEKKFIAKGVSACATCDGAFFRNVEVAVVGGGDTAMEEANFLTRFASKVYIIHRRDSFRASKIMVDRALKNPKIEPIWDSEVSEVMGTQFVESLRIRNIKTGVETVKPMGGLFVAIGHKPNTDIFKSFIHTNETGYIRTKPDSSYTNVDGVFACGDCKDHVYRQAVTAAGSGCMAAIDAERWLEANGE